MNHAPADLPVILLYNLDRSWPPSDIEEILAWFKTWKWICLPSGIPYRQSAWRTISSNKSWTVVTHPARSSSTGVRKFPVFLAAVPWWLASWKNSALPLQALAHRPSCSARINLQSKNDS